MTCHFRVLNLSKGKRGRRKRRRKDRQKRGEGEGRETFWGGSISFTKLPGVYSRKKVKTAFIWHVSDRSCCTGWVLDRRPQDTEQ